MLERYTEVLADSEPIRACYAKSVDCAVEMMRHWAKQQREAHLTPQTMAEKREDFRLEYASLLGIDVCRQVFGEGVPFYEMSFAGEDELTSIHRMKIKIAEDVYFTGLLLIPKKRAEKAPIAVMSHGGGGSPELCCDMIGKNNYGGAVRALLEKGIIIFAHQLLLWNLSPVLCESPIPQYMTKYDRSKTNHQMRHCGASIVAFEIYCISRTLDCLLQRADVDASKCGMLGLSYGGFYTLYTMAYDTRIKVGFSAACYNDRMVYDWHDMVWDGSAASFLDAEVAGLCAPRRLIIDIGREDTVFDYRSGATQQERTCAFFEAAGVGDHLLFNVWDGGHRFSMPSLARFAAWLGM